jgi:isopentenyl diphosphate isomerase/L-lactate dehydrogenase-like FMN-dependent dehydrogenase
VEWFKSVWGGPVLLKRIRIAEDTMFALNHRADVVRARALGAKACMIGRAWLYGLASGGQPGVERALEILRDEIDVTLTLLGRPTFSEIDRRILQG